MILLYHSDMPHTHASNLVHCVFSTKHRANRIPHPDALCRYISGIAKAKHITLLAAGGTANHLHLLIALPPAMPLAQAMRDLKGNSSRMLSEMGQRFSWQEGYGAFSVSHSQRQVVADYIANQEPHHHKWTFEQEFVALLRKAGIEYDPRFVFG
jgi:putative transposase